ncbi:hypothetical protein LQW54_012006 [Pestalotiopsis sp. IQ-011]
MDRNDGSEGNAEVGTDLAEHPTLDHSSPRKRKRTRVTKACETCRKRKERCDGVSPSCGSCASLGRSCSYASQSRRRGLPPGFVHSREVLLGLLLQVYDGAEDLILQALRGNQSEIQHSAQQRCPQRPCESLLSTWRKSKAATELDKVLDATESKEDDSSSEAQTFDAKLTSLLNACTIQSLVDSTTVASDHGMVTPAATSSLVNEPDDVMHDTLPDLPSDRVQGFPPSGRAVYVAIDLSIHVAPKHPSPEIRPDDPRKRAFVSCFFFDTLVASRLGRRPHFQSHDLDQFEDFRTESLEEWDSWRPFGHNTHGTLARTAQGPARILSVWNKLLYVIRLLNRKLWTTGDHVGGGRNQARFLLDQLVAWQAGLPSAMRIIDGTGFAPIMDAPHTINLTLAMASLYLMLLSEAVSDTTTDLNQASIKCHFPEQGWTQIVEFLRQLSGLDRNFSAGWMPPIFEIYIISLDRSRKVLCPELSGWEEVKNSILGIVQDVWVHSHLEESSSMEEAAILPPSTQLPRAIPTDKSFTFDETQQEWQWGMLFIQEINKIRHRDQ